MVNEKKDKDLNKEKIILLKASGYEHVMNIELHKIEIQRSQQAINQINQELNNINK